MAAGSGSGPWGAATQPPAAPAASAAGDMLPASHRAAASPPLQPVSFFVAWCPKGTRTTLALAMASPSLPVARHTCQTHFYPDARLTCQTHFYPDARLTCQTHFTSIPTTATTQTAPPLEGGAPAGRQGGGGSVPCCPCCPTTCLPSPTLSTSLYLLPLPLSAHFLLGLPAGSSCSPAVMLVPQPAPASLHFAAPLINPPPRSQPAVANQLSFCVCNPFGLCGVSPSFLHAHPWLRTFNLRHWIQLLWLDGSDLVSGYLPPLFPCAAARRHAH